MPSPSSSSLGVRKSPRAPRRSAAAATGTTPVAADVKQRAVRRNKSMGAPLIEAEPVQAPPSRRNVPGPRKSAVRAQPPQVFDSPSNVVISPAARKYATVTRSRASMLSVVKQPLEASAAANSIMTLVAPAEARQSVDSGSASNSSGDSTRSGKEVTKSFPRPGQASENTEATGVFEQRRRRVTFGTMAAITNFQRDEPTMRIQPAGVTQGGVAMPDMTNSSASRNDDSMGSSESESDGDDANSLLMKKLGGSRVKSASEIEQSIMADDSSMEMTQPLGRIVTSNGIRRRDSGMPASQPMSEEEEESTEMEDSTMDMSTSTANVPDGDRTQTMQFTVAMGAIIANAGMQDDESDVSDSVMDEVRRDADNSAMEMTEAVGGIRHTVGRSSIGSRSLQSRGSRSSLVPDESAMDMTQVVGGIVGSTSTSFDDETQDQSAFTAPGDSSNMDMTVAYGQIVATHGGDASEMDMTVASPAIARARSSVIPAASPRQVAQSPRRGNAQSHTTAAETPTRRKVAALASSSPAIKRGLPSAAFSPAAKRQAFEPIQSPRRVAAPYSPMRSSAPLRMTDPDSPRFPHSPARRITIPRPPDMPLPSSPVKASRVASPVKPIYRATSPTKVEAQSPVVRTQPRALGGAARHGTTAPRRLSLLALANTSVEMSEVSQDASLPSAEAASSADVASLSVSDFFATLGVTFHEDLTSVRRRRLPYAEPQSAQVSGAQVEMMRQAKVVAAAVPMLNSLVAACRDLEERISDNRFALSGIEERFKTEMSQYAYELMSCAKNDATRKELETQCKLQKSAARAKALTQYYGWRHDNQFGPENIAQLELNKAKLIEDAQIVREEVGILKLQVLPVLQQRHAELINELTLEKQRREQIAQSDPQVMEELHEGIVEQGALADTYRERNTNLERELARLDAKLAEVNAKRAAETAAIEAARAVYEQIKGCTKTEAARLKREIQNLEASHLWRLRTSYDEGLVLVYDETLNATIYLDDAGMVAQSKLSLAPTMRQSTMARWMLNVLQADLKDSGMDLHGTLRRIARTCGRSQLLHSAFEHLASCCPTKLSLNNTETQITLQAELLLPVQRAKLRVRITCGANALLAQDALLAPGMIDVECVYGNVEAKQVQHFLSEALQQHQRIGGLSEICSLAVQTFDV